MSYKSVKFTLEITIGTLNEEIQTKEMVDELSKALAGGIGQFAKDLATGTDGQVIGSVKITEQSEDWE